MGVGVGLEVGAESVLCPELPGLKNLHVGMHRHMRRNHKATCCRHGDPEAALGLWA